MFYAKDQGEPSLTSSATVHVAVIDINDNDPEFVFPSPSMGAANISISYLEVDSSELTKVSARDLDEGENAKLSFLFYPYLLRKEIFYINSTSGYVYITESPGIRNIGKTFILKVVVFDHGSTEQRYSTSILRITVTNISPVLQVKNKIDFSRIPASILDKIHVSKYPQFYLWGTGNSALTIVLSGVLLIIILAIITTIVCVYQKIQLRMRQRDNTISACSMSQLDTNLRRPNTENCRQRPKTPFFTWRLMASALHLPYKGNPITSVDVPATCSNDYVDCERESFRLMKTYDIHKTSSKAFTRPDGEYDIIRAMAPRPNNKRPLSIFQEVSWYDESAEIDDRIITII